MNPNNSPVSNNSMEGQFESDNSDKLDDKQYCSTPIYNSPTPVGHLTDQLTELSSDLDFNEFISDDNSSNKSEEAKRELRRISENQEEFLN